MAPVTDVEHAADPHRRIAQLLTGHCVEQALHVAAGLGIADRLADGAVSSDDLARATGAHGPSLYRLLRLLAGLGVFAEDRDRRFALTPLGATLRSDAPGSMRDPRALLRRGGAVGGLGDLRHAVMTGESAFEHVQALPFYDYLARHPAIGGSFNRFMTRMSEQQTPPS